MNAVRIVRYNQLNVKFTLRRFDEFRGAQANRRITRRDLPPGGFACR
jgi:hypothetical protein